MERAHVAFFSFPHDSHFNATLPILSVLVRRGYRVSCVTSDRFRSRVEQIGADVVRCPQFDVSTVFQKDTDPPDRFDHPFCKLALRTLAQTTPLFESDRPDLIIYDLLGFAGRLLAEKWNIPAIQISPHLALSRDVFTAQVPDTHYQPELLDLSRRADAFFAHHGVTNGDFIFDRERLNIFLFPKCLQPALAVRDETCVFAGRCAGEQAHFGDWDARVAGGRPIVLVSSSTSYVSGTEYFEMCIVALAGLGWHVILSIGSACDPRSLGHLPAHFEINQRTSHGRILAHTDLFICMGGTITTAEAAYHGVPLLALTHGFPELECLGHNIERKGIGTHVLKAHTNAENLRRVAVQMSSDHALAGRVRLARASVRREPGAEETVNRMEEYLADRAHLAENL